MVERLKAIGDCERLELVGERCFIDVGPISVHIARTDEGVVVDLWGHEDDENPLASAYAYYAEVQEPI
jgi:hypothetical protein